MAIQHRRGVFNHFDPTKLLPGEWAVVLSGDSSAEDGRSAYICFAAGDVKRVATFEDMVENIRIATADVVEEVEEEFTADIETATARANAAALAAETGEASRTTAEAARVSAESGRVTAELGRVTAEAGRVAAENARESAKGSPNGYAELDANGKVPSSQLPSYVDDVVEVADASALPSTGENGKIYVTLDDNKCFRWSGSAYVEISPSLALGETSVTAYRGDRGADAYAHAVTNKGSAFANGLYKVGTNSEGHVTTAIAVAKSDITDLGIPAQDTVYTLPPATTSALGGVKPDGTTVTVEPDGTLHGASTYELPTMSASVKGGAKVGSGLSIDANGVLSASGAVSGVKGAEESTYRTGDVNLTPANIGALDEDDYMAGMTWDTLAARFTWDDLAGNPSSDTYTSNLGLTKPSRVSAAAFNNDMDLLDSVIGDVDVSQDGDLQSQVSNLAQTVYQLETDVTATSAKIGMNGNASKITPFHWANTDITGFFLTTPGGDYTIEFSTSGIKYINAAGTTLWSNH